MPCKTEEPSPVQIEGKLAAELTLYVYKEIGSKPPVMSVAMAKEYFPKTQDIHLVVRKLCSTLRDLREVSPTEFERIVYNAKSKTSRQLADWWEAHQEMDNRRVAAEKKAEKEDQLADEALDKLSEEEIKALKKRWGATL